MLASGLVLLAACHDSASDESGDVKAACQIRAAWTQAEAEPCTTCIISAYTSDDCDCKKDEYRGLCNAQLVARNAEADCTYDVDQCAYACGTDCNCVDECYASHPTCKPIQAAYDSCIADVCNDACK